MKTTTIARYAWLLFERRLRHDAMTVTRLYKMRLKCDGPEYRCYRLGKVLVVLHAGGVVSFCPRGKVYSLEFERNI